MSTQPHLPARFRPLRPAERWTRLALVLVGPVVWIVALVVLAFVLRHADAVEYALGVLGVSFCAALLLLGWLRRRRDREEA